MLNYYKTILDIARDFLIKKLTYSKSGYEHTINKSLEENSDISLYQITQHEILVVTTRTIQLYIIELIT